MAENKEQVSGTDQVQQTDRLALQYNAYNKGIVTEASPFNFPPDTSRDEQNFVLYKNGTRARRYGLNLDTNQILGTGLNTDQIDSLLPLKQHTFIWENPGNEPDLALLVVIDYGVIAVTPHTTYLRLIVYDYDYKSGESPGETDGTGIVYSSFIAAPDTAKPDSISVARGYDGNLLIVGLSIEPTLVSFDAPSTITTSKIRISVRDLYGIYSTTAVNRRPVPSIRGAIETLTYQEDRYNLRNQGWGIAKNRVSGADNYDMAEGFSNVNAVGEFPSAADTPHTWQKTGSAGSGDIWNITKMDIGSSTTEASKGHFVLDYFDLSFSREEELETEETRSAAPPPVWTSPVNDKQSLRFDSCAFFSGRAWYAMSQSNKFDFSTSQPAPGDSKSPSYTTTILFSQTIIGTDSLGKCYTQNDPTHHTVNQVLATDGGTVSIPEAGSVLQLVPAGRYLYVLASQGVWAIGPGTGDVFSAEDISVRKVSSKGALNKWSATAVEDSLVYCAKDAMYLLKENGDIIEVQDITTNAIRTLYLSIFENNDKNYDSMQVVYDQVSRKIVVGYASKNFSTNTELKYVIDSLLEFDIELGAWTKQNWGLYSPASYTYDNTRAVITSLGTTPYQINGVREKSGLYFVQRNLNNGVQNISILTMRNTFFRDWESSTTGSSSAIASDAPAYLLTGYELAQDMLEEKAALYLYINCKRTEQNFIDNGSGEAILDNQSSCIYQVRWGFTDSVNSSRWTTEREGYRFLRAYSGEIGQPFDYGHDVISTRNKVRGHGKALSIYFKTSPFKDLQLLSWAVVLVGG